MHGEFRKEINVNIEIYSLVVSHLIDNKNASRRHQPIVFNALRTQFSVDLEV